MVTLNITPLLTRGLLHKEAQAALKRLRLIVLICGFFIYDV